MIIWSGKGFLVPIIAFVFLISTQLATNAAMGDPQYYQVHGWPKLLASFLAAIVVWFLGRYLNGKNIKVLVDKETGKEFAVKPNNAFFFVPIEYWGPIIIVLGVVLLFVK